MPKTKEGYTYYVDEDGKVITPDHMPVICRFKARARFKAWYRSLWPRAKPWVITALLKMRNAITLLIDKLY